MAAQPAMGRTRAASDVVAAPHAATGRTTPKANATGDEPNRDMKNIPLDGSPHDATDVSLAVGASVGAPVPAVADDHREMQKEIAGGRWMI